MGFSDSVTIEQEYAEYGIGKGERFQTKSLYAGMGEFTITEGGNLVEHLYRIEDDPDSRNPITGWPRGKRVDMGRKVIEYHGDILLHRMEPDRQPQEIVVRFTHGRLEWLRPLSEYPEVNRGLLVEQGAR